MLIGTAGTFLNAASSTLVAQTVPPEVFENAATWNSSSFQLASVIGPALGGFVIAWRGGSATLVYVLDAVAILISVVLLLFLRGRPVERPHEAPSLQAMAAGVGYIWRTQVILAAITLDMFAVLLGGATTLLPIYATDILHVGATGLGWLRAAPSVGAVSMALLLAHAPPFKKAGRVLLLAVAGFGVATIVFGASHIFWLSILMLAVLGGLDNISVVIRSTLMLLRTPDELRGRISAVNNVFIGTSNELGGFESGLAATIFGPVLAVVSGGVGTILIVLLVAWIWPEMRRLGRLNPEVTPTAIGQLVNTPADGGDVARSGAANAPARFAIVRLVKWWFPVVQVPIARARKVGDVFDLSTLIRDARCQHGPIFRRRLRWIGSDAREAP